VLGTPQNRGSLLKQDIYLDPIGTDIIFAAPRALRIDLNGGVVTVDDMGSLAVPNATARLHYQVESEVEPSPGAPADSSIVVTELSERARNRYLQLPPLSPAIAKLARDMTAGTRSPRDAAVRLTDYLSTTFRYTLAKPQTSMDPLDEFLFERRSGNCEYFAAALAVMLRTLDIPARVVGGFQRGEWNPYGRYFMVRLSDAHAWVEAYFDGVGWVTLDPSPRALIGFDDRPSLVMMYLDAARMRWYRYVINWSLQDQRLFASSVQRQARDASLALAWPREWRGKIWYLAPVVVGAVIALAWLLRHGGGVGPARQSRGRPPRFYERALKVLARRGFSPEPAETARQFCTRAQLGVPALAASLAAITAAYERARFGLSAPTEAELREVERCLTVLERR
jgi:transglutaminase-like putative cysteine protease